MGLTVTELVGLLALIAGLGLTIGGAFMASVLAGIFTLAGILLLVGISLLYLAAVREARAKQNGQHTVGGLRAAA